MDNFYRRMKPTLGTFVEIGIDKTIADPEQVVSEAFRSIENLSRKLNFHSDESELSFLNNSNGEFVKLSQECVKVIRLAKEIGKASNEKFNCTMGNSTNFSEPVTGTSDDIVIFGDQVQIRSNLKIVLDGIAKGFAVDLAINLLKKRRVKSGWVNAGGDLRVFGELEWPIYIRDPFCNSKALIKLKNAAIATSFISSEKDSERFTARYLQNNNKKYGIGLVSVVSKMTWKADALTKVAANLDASERTETVKKLGGELIELYEGYIS